ncbi:hypothetical protein ACLB2K_069962 [Fragaria x ananassa]
MLMESLRFLHVLILLLFINLLQPTTVVGSLGNADHLALLKFKESIVADPHGFLNSWNDSVHFCKWGGITCGRRHQRVTALKLLHLELHGTISPYIGNLSFLRTFSLLNNSFSGKIPQQVDHLFRLRDLTLSYNMLEGEIPVNLTFCRELRIINSASNRLTGKIPSEIGSLMKLVFLNLQINNLTGGIPPSLGNLSSLTTLSLSGNNLVGNVPEELGVLKSLSFFGISLNNLHGMIPPSLFNISSMNVFVLTSNKFEGSIPPSIGLNMPNLQKLYLSDNEFSGQIPASISNASQLQELDLGENNFVGQVPASLGNLPLLQFLSLEFNKLGSNSSNDLEFITSLTNCSIMEVLALTSNNFGGALPNSVANFSTQLTGLYLGSNQVAGTIPETLGNFKNLILLALDNNLFTSNIPASLGKLSKLQILSLSTNRLSGWIPSSLGNLTQLFRLQLYANELEGIIPPDVGNCRSLQSIDLSHNNLSGDIPSQVIGMSSLSDLLNLSQNSLTGSLPVEVELQLPACTINVPKLRQFRGFKLKLTISLVVGCSLLFAFLLVFYWRRNTLKKELLSEAESINFLSKVSYQTLHQVTGGFSPSNQIGSGGFGSVYKGILDQEENIVVAIKVLNLQQKGASKSFMAECNALRNIRHRNLVKIITCCSSTDYNGNDFKALVFEYMSNASLEDWLYRENQPRSGLNLLQRLNIVVDVASALWYLHDHCEPQIIHRDLKPSNVLLDGDMVARVGDFGLARLIPPSTDSSENQTSTVGIKGTIGYAAPEYAVGVEPSTQGDVYSYGILVLQLFTGRRPTDEMFVDGCNIHTFVKTCIQGRLMEIVDPTLIATLEEETTISTTNNEVTRIHAFSYDIETGGDNIDNQNSSRMNNYAGKCILPILKIGLACSEESPRNRMSMEEVHRDLHRIKDAYNGISIRRERPRRS